MKFQTWRGQFVSATSADPVRSAQLWNLEHETRVGRKRGVFKRLVSGYFQKLVRASVPPRSRLSIEGKTSVDH